MRVFTKIEEVRSFVAESRKNGKNIGLVPTMGALHKGHFALVRASLQENDITIATIFVNQLQFNNSEDFDKYPRTDEEDKKALQDLGCDAVFMPSHEEMYPEPSTLELRFGIHEYIMEGSFRKDHFKGVGIVVSKLFHIIPANRAYFGQKDLQQFAIIQKLVTDLSFDIELRRVPTVRDKNGLALSSRNKRLSDEEKQWALSLSQALNKSKELIQNQSLQKVKESIRNSFEQNQNVELEYFEIVHLKTFENLDTYIKGETACCIAANIGHVRLIDNIVI